jgi:UDP-N-acetyl-D-glucosamine dehydrogenase
VDYCDPYFPKARHGRKHKLEMSSVACTAETFAGYDALVLSTGHKQFKDPALYANVRLVVDTRNAVKLPDGAKGRLVKA